VPNRVAHARRQKRRESRPAAAEFRQLALSSALLAATASLLTAATFVATTLLLAPTTLLFTFALVAFLLLASLLSRTTGFTGFIGITLCFHSTFRFINF
jgi:hypothetical protein